MPKVKRRHGESLDQLISRFNRMVAKSGMYDDMKERQSFTKKSEKRRMQKKALDFKKRLERERSRRQ